MYDLTRAVKARSKPYGRDGERVCVYVCMCVRGGERAGVCMYESDGERVFVCVHSLKLGMRLRYLCVKVGIFFAFIVKVGIRLGYFFVCICVYVKRACVFVCVDVCVGV